MIELVYALVAGIFTVIAGAVPLRWNIKSIRYIIGFASGTVITVAFLDLLPEINVANTSFMIAVGFFVFYLLEKLLMIHSCGESECKTHSMSWVSVFGMSLDNFVDGIAIAVSFLASPALGLMITIAVIIHEIPQDITSTLIMKHLKYSNVKVMIPIIIAGALYPIGAFSSIFVPAAYHGHVIAFVAGAFIYVGVGDLLPEAHKKFNLKVIASVLIGVFFVVGVGLLTGV